MYQIFDKSGKKIGLPERFRFKAVRKLNEYLQANPDARVKLKLKVGKVWIVISVEKEQDA